MFNSPGGGVPLGRSPWNFQWMSRDSSTLLAIRSSTNRKGYDIHDHGYKLSYNHVHDTTAATDNTAVFCGLSPSSITGLSPRSAAMTSAVDRMQMQSANGRHRRLVCGSSQRPTFVFVLTGVGLKVTLFMCHSEVIHTFTSHYGEWANHCY